MCGTKCGQCFVLSLFFNGPRLFCDYVAHNGKGSGTAAARHQDAGRRGQGAQGPPAHALRGLHIPEPPGIVASPDQRFDDPLYQRYVSLSQHKQKSPRGIPDQWAPRKLPASAAGHFLIHGCNRLQYPRRGMSKLGPTMWSLRLGAHRSTPGARLPLIGGQRGGLKCPRASTMKNR